MTSNSPFDSRSWGSSKPKTSATSGPSVPPPPKPPLRKRIAGFFNGKGSGPEPRTGAARALAATLSIALAGALGLGAGFATKTYVVQPFKVPSESMYPTLTKGDRLVVEKLTYILGEPTRGQVIVFSGEGIYDPEGTEQFYVKRIIATEGDTVQCCDKKGRLIVNGASVSEKYLKEGTKTSSFPKITVPEGEVFVLGDNRGNSTDSRYVGTIPIDQIVGHVFARVWPMKRIHSVPVS